MNMANDGSLNRHGGQADMESNADERARERAEAVEARMFDTLWANRWNCPECAHKIMPMGLSRHLRECELLRARAEAEVDRG
jgi:hypothetical protein